MIRRRIPEEMDRPDVDLGEHAHALRSLNRINGLLGVHFRLRRQIECLSPRASVLDLGCGGGGLLGHLSSTRKQQLFCLLIGLDRSPFALRCAGRWHSKGVRWVAADALRIPLADDSVDVVASSLFLHHLERSDAVTLLRDAARVARRAVVVGDLGRSWSAWVLTAIMTRVLSRSRLVQVDGPRSVRAAFTAGELADVAEEAGLEGASVARQFPFRLVLTWSKTVSRTGSR